MRIVLARRDFEQLLEYKKETHHGPWNPALDVGRAATDHSAAGDVFAQLIAGVLIWNRY
jgi:hypothetical protein